MFIYDTKIPIKIEVSRPNPKYYLLLDLQLEGTKHGLEQATVYIRQSFMIHNQEFHDMFMRLGAKLMSDMEVLARLIHLMHGEDDRYYDESNDDTPVFEYIKPCNENKTIEKHTDPNAVGNKHHVNNDLTAAVIRDIAYEEEQLALYKKVDHHIEDEKAHLVFEYLIASTQKRFDILENLLTILTSHQEVKDFGLGDSHNAWDLDTSNYFDKPNPTFLNPEDLIDLSKDKL